MTATAVTVQPPVQSPPSVQPVMSPAKVQMIPQLDGYDGDSESDSDDGYPISIPQYDGNDSDGSSSGPTLPSHGTHGIVLAVSGPGKKGLKTQQSPQKAPQLVLKIVDKKKDVKGDSKTIPQSRAGVSPVAPASVRINKRGTDIITSQSQPNIITLTGNQTRQIKGK